MFFSLIAVAQVHVSTGPANCSIFYVARRPHAGIFTHMHPVVDAQLRPHCSRCLWELHRAASADTFLRLVSRWYEVVVFTASLQVQPQPWLAAAARGDNVQRAARIASADQTQTPRVDRSWNRHHGRFQHQPVLASVASCLQLSPFALAHASRRRRCGCMEPGRSAAAQAAGDRS